MRGARESTRAGIGARSGSRTRVRVYARFGFRSGSSGGIRSGTRTRTRIRTRTGLGSAAVGGPSIRDRPGNAIFVTDFEIV